MFGFGRSRYLAPESILNVQPDRVRYNLEYWGRGGYKVTQGEQHVLLGPDLIGGCISLPPYGWAFYFDELFYWSEPKGEPIAAEDRKNIFVLLEHEMFRHRKKHIWVSLNGNAGQFLGVKIYSQDEA